MVIFHVCLNFFRLLGRRASTVFVIATFCGLLLAGIEAAFAVAVAAVLKLLGLGGEVTHTDFFMDMLAREPMILILLIPALALLRSATYWLVDGGVSFVDEYVRGRLRQLSVYRVLYSEGDRYISTNDIHSLNGSILTGTITFVNGLSNLLPSTLTAVALLCWMLYLKPYQSIFAVATMVITGVLFSKLNESVSKLVSRQLDLTHSLVSTTSRIAQNWLLIRSCNLQASELVSVSSVNSRSVKDILKARISVTAVSIFPSVIGASMVSVLLFLQLRKGASADNMNFIAMVYLIVRFVDASTRVSRGLSYILPQAEHYKKALEFFLGCTPSERMKALTPFHQQLEKNDVNAGQQVAEIKPRYNAVPLSLEVKDLYYSFNAHGRELYNNLNFVLAKGQQMGLVGPSGSGKSTLLCLILGILKPLKGHVSVNGKVVEKFLEHPDLRLGFVSAEPFLFGGTIKENLDYGQDTRPDPADYRDVLSSVMLLKPGQSLEEFLARPIRDDMSGLSMGEKQRLCLARALLRNPNFIILDEITANLDAKTESEVVEVLYALKSRVTIIFVSHRINALAGADFILDLESKQLTTFGELKKKSLAA